VNPPADSLAVAFLPGAARRSREHLLAGQQLDNLCGCHWAAILLRTDGVEADAESLALEAGTALPVGDPSDSVPAIASPRLEYRVRLPLAERREEAGTAVPGLMAAVSRASAGARDLVPLRAAWTAERVAAVIELCRERPEWEAVPLANVRTGRFWGSCLPLADALAWLSGDEVETPKPDWDVGHFVTIAGTWDGAARSLVIVRDSYPMFGWDAHHLQPPESLAAALERGDGREGGIALYVSSDDRPEVETAAKEAGFEIAAWDNGTPWPRAKGGSE